MKKDTMGDRMKTYEASYNLKYPIRLPLILRIDGKSFHSMVKKWKCSKPFDDKLISAMANTTKYLCETIAGAQIAYTQSDEITILVRDDINEATQPWFNKEMNKVLSIVAAKATKAFIFNYFDKIPDNLEMLPEFDCRGFIVPEYEILNCFLWRQQDCSKNSVQMLARAHFSHKRLQGLNGSQLQELLHEEKGINWNNLETHKKRGLCVVKKQFSEVMDNKNPHIDSDTNIVTRHRWTIDLNIPIFSREKDYINKFARLVS